MTTLVFAFRLRCCSSLRLTIYARIVHCLPFTESNRHEDLLSCNDTLLSDTYPDQSCITSGVQPATHFHPYITVSPINPTPRLIPSAELVESPNTLFFPLGPCDPECLLVFHDIGQDGSSKEDHVFSTRGIFDSDFEVLSSTSVPPFCPRAALKSCDHMGQLTFKRLPPRTRVRYSCFISFSRRDGKPGYIDEPPDRTMCL
jgi:hypothetical protein